MGHSDDEDDIDNNKKAHRASRKRKRPNRNNNSSIVSRITTSKMKWPALSLSLFALFYWTCSSSPVAVVKNDTMPTYRLRVSSTGSPPDGFYLSLSGTSAWTFVSDASRATHLYAVPSKQDSLVELHTYPSPYSGNPGIIDHRLALIGTADGLMTLSDVTNPAAPGAAVPPGQTCDSSSFSLGPIGGGDGSATWGGKPVPGNSLAYAGGSVAGSWLAWPPRPGSAGWTIKWRGNAFTTEDYMPINIVYERVTA